MIQTIRSSRRPLLGAAAGLLLAHPLPAQRFEGILQVHSAGMKADAGMTYFIKGERLRLEIVAPGQAPIVMISDGAARKQYVLFADQKVYTTMTFAELLHSTDSLRKQSAKLLLGASMTPLGTTATVADHKCAVHRYRDAKSAYNICLTTELGAVGGVSGLFGNIGPSLDATNPPQWVQQLIKAGSFALRVGDTTGKTTWEVRKTEAKRLDPGLFAPPAGFSAVSDAPGTPKRPSPR